MPPAPLQRDPSNTPTLMGFEESGHAFCRCSATQLTTQQLQLPMTASRPNRHTEETKPKRSLKKREKRRQNAEEANRDPNYKDQKGDLSQNFSQAFLPPPTTRRGAGRKWDPSRPDRKMPLFFLNAFSFS